MQPSRSQLPVHAPVRFLVLLTTTAVVCFVFINWFLSSRDIDHMPTATFWTPTYVVLCVTVICATFMPKAPLTILPAAILGIAVGVAWDALTDTQRDRNLFPIEMLIWTGFSMPGALVGTLVGSLFYLLKRYIGRVAPSTLRKRDIT
jgi:hypothetical protein